VTAADAERLLDTYERLSLTTGQMLAAARSGEWERLIELEQDCAQLTVALSALESDDPLPAALRERKANLLRKLLADDAAIRDITEPWVKRLESTLGANRRERRLLDAYGPPPLN